MQSIRIIMFATTNNNAWVSSATGDAAIAQQEINKTKKKHYDLSPMDISDRRRPLF